MAKISLTLSFESNGSGCTSSIVKCMHNPSAKSVMPNGNGIFYEISHSPCGISKLSTWLARLVSCEHL